MTAATLNLQDPTAGGGTLLHALSQAAKDAESGGGLFAFASKNGLEMLFDDKYFRRLAKSRGFELVVGIDAITNERACKAMGALDKSLAKLTTRVLLHGTPNLMHPKLCWFAAGDRMTLIIGSGNLTPGGLMTNFEAFAVCPLSGAAAGDAKAEIGRFLTRWESHLLHPEDPAVLERAAKNTGSERSLLKKMKDAPELPPASPPPAVTSEVLIAEISKNVDERTQLDVGIDMFTGFFGAKPEGGHILIQAVDSGGELQEVEGPRAIFPTKSHNYRFEARAGAGRKYPAEGTGRPFGVFVRMPDGIFRYQLLWPQEPGHAEVDALLTARVGPAKNRMRREIVTLAELRAGWPSAPLLKTLKKAS
jgi:HKD family nuclease